MGKAEEVKRRQALRAWKKRWGFKKREGSEVKERNGFFDDANASQGERSPKTAEMDKKSLKEDKARLDKVFQARNESGSQPRMPRKRKARDDSDIDYVPSDKNKKADDVFAQEAATTAALDQYDPLQAPFARAVVRRRRVRLVLDATATQDQASQTAYTESRRKELDEVAPNHYLAKEYGLRTAKSQLPFEEQGGMRIANPQSSVYLRDNPGKAVETLFAEVYKKNGKKQRDFDAKRMVVVNSAKTLEKLEAFYGSEWTNLKNQFKGSIETIAEGFHVIVFKAPPSPKDLIKVITWINTTGSMPSSYDALRSLSGGKSGTDSLGDPTSPDSLGNKDTLNKLVDGSGRQALQNVPEKHPMKNVATAAAQLVGGLKDTLTQTLAKKGDAFEKSPLVESALKNLDNLMEAMPTYLDDTPRFTKLFDVMIDEVYLLLATCQPYDEESYKKQAKNLLFERAPALKEMVDEEKGAKGESEIGVETFAMSSGMGAISNAIQAAVACSGVMAAEVDVADEQSAPTGEKSANYFELQGYLLTKDKPVNDKGKVLVATLNPSTPTTKMGGQTDNAWGIKELNDKIDKKIETLGQDLTPESPLTVVIDITVEKSAEKSADNELNQLFNNCDSVIRDGLVMFVLCKSYQKYPSLGAAKVMAGGVSVVGKKSERLTKLTDRLKSAEKETGLMNKDEGQLMTHLLANGGDVELPMLKHAADNAKFLAKNLIKPGAKGPYLYSDDLPFAVVSDLKLVIEGGGKAEKQKIPRLLRKAGLDSRDSFGFQNSSYLAIGEGRVRLNPGQEPPSELVEKFFVMGKLTGSIGPIKVDQVTKFAQEAADVAFADVEEIMALPEEPKNDMGEAQNKPKAKDPRAVWQEHRTQVVREMFQEVGEDALTQVDSTAAEAMNQLRLADVYRDWAKKNENPTDAERQLKIADGHVKEADTIFAKIWDKVEKDGHFPDKRFAAKVKLVSLAAAPKLDDASRAVPKLQDEPQAAEDPNLMKAAVDWGWKGSEQSSDKLETNYLQNIVASCARFGAAVFEAPEDRGKMAGLVEALTATPGGLSRVSPEMKEVLLTQQTRQLLEKRPFPTEEKARKAHLAKMQNCLKEMPYTDGAANLFARESPAELYRGVETKETQEMQELTDCFLKELPLESKIDLVARLAEQGKKLAQSAEPTDDKLIAQDYKDDAQKAAKDAENASKKGEEAVLKAKGFEAQATACNNQADAKDQEAATLEEESKNADTNTAEQKRLAAKQCREEAAVFRSQANAHMDQAKDLHEDAVDYFEDEDEFLDKVDRFRQKAKEFDDKSGQAKECLARAWACVKHMERELEAGKKVDQPAARETLSSSNLGNADAQQKPKQLTKPELADLEKSLTKQKEVLLTEEVRLLLKNGATLTENDFNRATTCVTEMPSTDDAANLFAQDLPVDLYTNVESNETPKMQKLTDCVLDPVDLKAKIELVARLVDQCDQLVSAAKDEHTKAQKLNKDAQDDEADAADAEQDAKDAHLKAERYEKLVQGCNDDADQLDDDAVDLDKEADLLQAATDLDPTKVEAKRREAQKCREDAVALRDEADSHFDVCDQANALADKYNEESLELKADAEAGKEKATALTKESARKLAQGKDCKVRAWACVKHLDRKIQDAKLPAAQRPSSTEDLSGAGTQSKPKQPTITEVEKLEVAFKSQRDRVTNAKTTL
jgi:hypothetical protein